MSENNNRDEIRPSRLSEGTEELEFASFAVPEREPAQECVPDAAGREAEPDFLALVRASMGPEPLDVILAAGRALPESYRDWPPGRMIQFVRLRLGFTQQELARKAGLAPSQISRLEGGKDCLLSTWARAYNALGVAVRVGPESDLTADELVSAAAEGRPPHARPATLRPHGPWFRS